MNRSYAMLLEATIQHLESLRDRGARHVVLSDENWRALTAAPVSARAPKARSESRPQEGLAGRIALPGKAQEPVRKTRPVPRKPAVMAAPRAPSVLQTGGTKVADRKTAMASLREEALACTKCANLVASRRQVVFGVGNIHADLMFVGEAPGRDEDVQGEPFVGVAGKLLTKIIQTMGFTRESVYIANVLKCRPDTPGQDQGNRKPEPQEMATCLPYLERQIQIIQPRVLVALGATAYQGLFGEPGAGITKLRGQWKEWNGIPLMPTFHPSYLLHQKDLRFKRMVWEDMLMVMERLGVPISEKQRGFFSSAK